MPVDVEVQTVPHFTALVNSKVGPLGLEGAGLLCSETAL